MITLPTSRAAGKTGSKASPSRSRRRGGARCKAFAAVAAAALVGDAGVAVEAGFRPPEPAGVALVIGNGDYEDSRVHSDASARTDAAGVAAALERLSFKVRHLEDAGYVDMLQGLLELSKEAQSARAAVVFYAGQGDVVVGSRNHLIPVDARMALGGDPDLDPGHHVTEGNLGLIPVTWLMRSVAGASNLRLVVLDAHVPAPLEQAGETIVALAAGVGDPPWSGEHRASGHSPYTEALLRYLEEPGLELGMLLRKVREDVMQATDGGQEPVVYWPGSGVSLSPLPLSGQTPVVDPDEAAKPGRAEAEAVVEPGTPFRDDAALSPGERPGAPGLVVEPGTPFRDDAEEAVPPQAPGTTFRDCPECPEMVVVPSGSFQMGSPESEDGRSDHEGPVRQVTIARPFAVGVYEVTFEAWDACVSGGGCVSRFSRSGLDFLPRDLDEIRTRPVVHVSWSDAQAYVRWLSEKTGEAYRLLSESEWEYVARAGTTGPYHFGLSISPSQANYGNNLGGTAPVGSYPANAFGLHDVHGNVWEWVEDCWNDSYRGAPSDGSAWTSGDCSTRVLRDGSWTHPSRFLRSAARGRDITFGGGRIQDGGIRVARTLTP